MKYENWRELARECQDSGMAVYSWCKVNSVPATTCRQWLAKLKKENQHSESANQDMDLSIWGKVDLEKPNQNASQTCHQTFPAAIKLNYHGWSIELNPGFDPLLLTRIMKVVESVC